MQRFYHLQRVALCVLLVSMTWAHAKDINLLPKYGSLPRSESIRQADREFIAAMGRQFGGDLKKASQAVVNRAWQSVQSGDAKTAMQRLNQAWLLNPDNAEALWGMAVISAMGNEFDTALTLFNEAAALDRDNVNLAVDHARTMSIAAMRRSDSALMKDAISRFEQLAVRAPGNAANWQNWAIALYYQQDYAGAWRKMAKMEALGPRVMTDPRFIEALTAKMPRPVAD